MNDILRFMQKHDEWTDGRKAFYSLPTTAFGRRWEIIMGYEASDVVRFDPVFPRT